MQASTDRLDVPICSVLLNDVASALIDGEAATAAVRRRRSGQRQLAPAETPWRSARADIPSAARHRSQRNSVRSMMRPSLTRPGDRAAKTQNAARIDDRCVAAERLGEREVLPAAGVCVTDRRLEPPQHLRTQMRMATGDDHAGRQAAAVAVVDRGGRGDVVVDVGVEGGQREELVVLAAAEGRDAGLAQRLADIDVLSGLAVLGHGALDQLVELSVPKMAACLSLPSRPSVQASSMRPSWQPSSQPSNRWPTCRRIIAASGSIMGATLVMVIGTTGEGPEGRSPPALRSEHRFAERIGGRLRRRRRHVLGRCLGCGRPARLAPCQTSAASTGLWLGSSFGRSTHCTILKRRPIIGAVAILHRLRAGAGNDRKLARGDWPFRPRTARRRP